jgi:hypothetical protein
MSSGRYIVSEQYDDYLDYYNELGLEEQRDEGPLQTREEYYAYRPSDCDFVVYTLPAIWKDIEALYYRLDANHRDWPKLLELIRATNPESWDKKFYQGIGIQDGTRWDLRVQIDGRQFYAEGRNAWPDELYHHHMYGESDLNSNIFDLLQKVSHEDLLK